MAEVPHQKPPAESAAKPSGPERRAFRLCTRLACLLAAVFVLLPPEWMSAGADFWKHGSWLGWIPQLHKQAWPEGPKFISGASPFVAVCSSVAARGVGLAVGAGLALAGVTLLARRRWFCRFVCPVGLALEWTGRVGFGRRATWWRRCLPLGQYAALLTLGGAVLGYPVLAWMDPLAFLSSASGAWAGNAISGILAGAGLAFMLVTALLCGPIWCGRLCPLGGMQDIFAALRSLVIKKQTSDDVTVASGDSPQVGAMPLARRALLAGMLGAAGGWWGRRSARAGTPPRPPGAAGEGRFTGLCIRCGMCVRVCPSKIIQPDVGQTGLAGLLAPRLSFDSGYCHEDCNACTRACPSGAIAPLSLEAKQKHVIGLAKIDRPACLLTQGQECGVCIKYCPLDAIRSVWDEKAYESVLVVDAAKCNGCGCCEMSCPTAPRAIRVQVVL